MTYVIKKLEIIASPAEREKGEEGKEDGQLHPSNLLVMTYVILK
jgi:hypothetical protein